MTSATEQLWQALAAMDSIAVGRTMKAGADVHQVNAKGQNPLQHMATRILTTPSDTNESEVFRQRRSIEQKLLIAGTPVHFPPDAQGWTIVGQALLNHACDFHDEANPTRLPETLGVMIRWLAHAKREAPTDQWQHDAAKAWGAYLNLYGEDSEGHEVPLDMELGRPMLDLLLQLGVPARVMQAVDTPSFNKERHFPFLAGRAVAEVRVTQAQALPAPTRTARRRQWS